MLITKSTCSIPLIPCQESDKLMKVTYYVINVLDLSVVIIIIIIIIIIIKFVVSDINEFITNYTCVKLH